MAADGRSKFTGRKIMIIVRRKFHGQLKYLFSKPNNSSSLMGFVR